MLDELILGGEIQETSKKKVLSAIQAQDSLQEVFHFNFIGQVTHGCTILLIEKICYGF